MIYFNIYFKGDICKILLLVRLETYFFSRTRRRAAYHYIKKKKEVKRYLIQVHMETHNTEETHNLYKT
jgi:hypothetical protein